MSALTDRIDPYTMSEHTQRVRPTKRSPRERFRLALRLLREYERQEANEKTAVEYFVIIERVYDKIKDSAYTVERGTGLDRWRAAVERHASKFRLPEEAK